MSTSPRSRCSSERALWWSAAVAVAAAGLVWAFSTPLFTGPDEVSQARRAAAVVRGELTGRQDQAGPPLLLTVEVPPFFGVPAEQNWLCHLGPLVAGAPQQAMSLPSPPCPDLRDPADGPGGLVPLDGMVSDDGQVAVETVQYRGQPVFYAVVGLSTLVDTGLAGAYGMRVVTVLVTAALAASALVSVARSRHRPLAGLGLLACLTPGVLSLAGSTNPSAVEIAASLSAWAAVAMLATTEPDQVTDPLTGRLVRRLGVALVVLAVGRGLGPVFALAVPAVGALAAGRTRAAALLTRRDLRWWGLGALTAIAASGVWLAYIGREYPLPERAGSGFARALGWLPWYVRQSVGVFGTNDSAVGVLATTAWCVVLVATVAGGIVVLGRQRGTVRQAVLAALTLGGGLAMNVTAEGLSLPPIGFFWQGRYALPLALGGVLLATTTRRGSLDPAASRPGSVTVAAAGGALLLISIHVHALLVVSDHHASPRGGSLVAASTISAAALAVVAVLAIGTGRRAGAAPGPASSGAGGSAEAGRLRRRADH